MRARSERGQTAAEYLGVLLIVSVIIATLATTDIGHEITIYEGIESLSPGCYLEVDLPSGELAVRPYWELRVTNTAPVSTLVSTG